MSYRYLKAKNRLITLNESDDSIADRAYRASGDCICDACGLSYYDHKYVENLLFDGDPWLVYLCSGDVVKL